MCQDIAAAISKPCCCFPDCTSSRCKRHTCSSQRPCSAQTGQPILLTASNWPALQAKLLHLECHYHSKWDKTCATKHRPARDAVCSDACGHCKHQECKQASIPQGYRRSYRFSALTVFPGLAPHSTAQECAQIPVRSVTTALPPTGIRKPKSPSHWGLPHTDSQKLRRWTC